MTAEDRTKSKDAFLEYVFYSTSLLPLVRKDLLHPADPAIIQSHLDSAGVVGGGREYILHNPDRSAAGSLILLQDDFDALTGSNVFPILAVHIFSPKTEEYSDTNPGKIQIREERKFSKPSTAKSIFGALSRQAAIARTGVFSLFRTTLTDTLPNSMASIRFIPLRPGVTASRPFQASLR